ncbi:MAG: hypothetical protein QM656_04915 [Paracoccaceae bacterium]
MTDDSDPAPEKAPPTPTEGAPPPPPSRAATARARRRKKNWIIAGAGAASAAVLGLAWTALSDVVAERTKGYFANVLDEFRGGAHIRQMEQELAFADQTASAYFPIAYHSTDFCMDLVREWTRQRGYPTAFLGEPQHHALTVTFYDIPVQVRCVGVAKSETVFVLFISSQRNGGRMDALYREMSEAFAGYSTYPAAVQPQDNKWIGMGPYSRVGYLDIEMPWAEARAWMAGAVPQSVTTALAAPGVRQFPSASRTNPADHLWVAQGPGAIIALLSPSPGSFISYRDAGGVMQPVAGGMSLGDAVPVVVHVTVSISGVVFGAQGMDSPDDRYLGADLDARLARIPGVQNGGAVQELIRNW